MRRMLILVAALALLTTACKIQINAEFTINADKSGAVILELGYDDEIKELAESSGESPESMFGDFDLEDTPGAVVTTERRGDMTFQIITVPIDDITAAEGLGGEMAAGLTDSFAITFTEDLVTVAGSTTLDDALGGSEDMAGIPPEMLSEFFEVNIRITMPGKILEHNATSQSGNTLTWAVNMTDPTLDISAQSNPNESAGGSSSMMVYIIIAAAVILLGLLLWMFMRKRGSTGGAGTAPPQIGMDDAPPAPPPSE